MSDTLWMFLSTGFYVHPPSPLPLTTTTIAMDMHRTAIGVHWKAWHALLFKLPSLSSFVINMATCNLQATSATRKWEKTNLASEAFYIHGVIQEKTTIGHRTTIYAPGPARLGHSVSGRSGPALLSPISLNIATSKLRPRSPEMGENCFKNGFRGLRPRGYAICFRIIFSRGGGVLGMTAVWLRSSRLTFDKHVGFLTSTATSSYSSRL